MGYHVIQPESEPTLSDRPCRTWDVNGPAVDREALDLLGIRLYTVEPGEQMPLQYHYHERQEEGFYVLSGELSFETPETTYTVEEGELFLVEPGSPQRAFNPSDAEGPVRVLAAGAPHDDYGKAYEP